MARRVKPNTLQDGDQIERREAAKSDKLLTRKV
jgi:hypothetical protein